MLKIRNATINDLSAVVKIEHLCFSKEEAATKESTEKRIRLIPDSYFVAEEDGIIAGLINGPVIKTKFITDDLFTNIQENPAAGCHQSILGLAVDPHHQKRGIAASLLQHLEKEAAAKKTGNHHTDMHREFNLLL